jgi:hypothetical protein
MKCARRNLLLVVVAAAASPVLAGDAEAYKSWPWPSLAGPSKTPQPDLAKAAAVKQVFQTAWTGYKQYAFPHDELAPLNNSYADDMYVCPHCSPSHWTRPGSLINDVGVLQKRMGCNSGGRAGHVDPHGGC